MMALTVLVVTLTTVIGSVLLGVAVFRFANEITEPPPLPPATVANPAPRESLYANTARAADRLHLLVRRRAIQLLGLVFIAVPLLAVFWLLTVLVLAD
jgi:hypothetical protein